MRTETITGELIELRPWRRQDAAWYVSARDDLVYTWTTERASLTTAEVADAIARVEHSPAEAAFAIWTTDGDLVGNLAFACADAAGEVSYFLAPAGRGRGLASEAVALGCTWMLANAAIDRLVAHVAIGNTASERVLERAGFVRTDDGAHPDLGPVSSWLLRPV